MTKYLTVHPKAKHALNSALAGIVVMVSILVAPAKWIMILGIVVSFLLSGFAIINSLVSMKLINNQHDIYRVNNMAWISFILGVLVFLSSLPFIIQFIGVVI